MKKHFLRIAFNIVILLFLTVEIAMAQPPDNPNDGENPFGVPIDGGLLYLIGAGISYGIYRIRRKKNQ